MPPWPFFSSSSKIRTPPPRDFQDALGPPSGYFDFQRQPDALYNDTSASISAAELEPPVLPFASTPPSRPHSRSLSSTLFGTGKKKSGNGSESSPKATTPQGEAQLDGANSPRKQTSKGKTEEAELEKGTCATCGSKMQWPRGVSEYRCATCSMVNDLKPIDQKSSNTRDAEKLTRSGTHPSPANRAQIPSINLERTRTIISQCVDAYLQIRRDQARLRRSRTMNHSSRRRPSPSPSRLKVMHLNGTNGQSNGLAESFSTSPTSSQPMSNLQLPGSYAPRNNIEDYSTGGLRPTMNNGSNAGMHTPKSPPARPSRSPPPPPTNNQIITRNRIPRKPVSKGTRPVIDGNDHDAVQDLEPTGNDPTDWQTVKTIFKPLEDYIAHLYADQQSLNSSFLLARPKRNNRDRSNDDFRAHDGVAVPEHTVVLDSPLSELDAKTLLLGDVAENGLWWTGRDTRASSVGRRLAPGKPIDHPTELVHSRSPLINWPEVHSWYRAVILAGVDWREKVKREGQAIEQNEQANGSFAPEGHDIDDAFAEARGHLHRILLKAAESVLKRPGTPLKHPSDTRFLLILLSNPLLYPTHSSPLMLSLGRESIATEKYPGDTNHARLGSSKAAISEFWEQGHAFSIIKRIVGLMSNLSTECHRFLTGWFSRYDEVFFRQLLALLQGFITHRLGRRHRRKISNNDFATNDLIPNIDEVSGSSAQLHAALGQLDIGAKNKGSTDGKSGPPLYGEDWQLKASARILALLFAANRGFQGRRQHGAARPDHNPTAISRSNLKHHGQLLSTSDFYNIKADYIDVAADFSSWESTSGKFSFCQYPFLLSVGVKIRMMEFDVQRQMDIMAREAFFDTLFRNKNLEQYLHLKVRRDCLIEDSLTAVDEAVAQGPRETKKALKVHFVDEPGVDAGGLRKEWFLLLVREIFDPLHGMFIYDDESHLCYFNPYSFETSNQYFLVGALLGFAIYNLTILDVALPPFLFKKLLSGHGGSNGPTFAFNRGAHMHYSLDDLSEYRPVLAKGLRKLLEYDGDVEETFCLDFVIEVDRYGSSERVALCPNGENTPVTNSNRQQFVDLYVRYLLDIQVARQFEPFRRGFFQVCSGNALSLFQPEEIELLIRGSAEPLDVQMLKAVAVYENFRRDGRKVEDPAEEVDLVRWFWEFFSEAEPHAQRRLLSFITGSDRIPATGAANLSIKIGFAGDDPARFPIARTCFNSVLLYQYGNKEELVEKLWRAVCESEGFGLQ